MPIILAVLEREKMIEINIEYDKAAIKNVMK